MKNKTRSKVVFTTLLTTTLLTVLSGFVSLAWFINRVSADSKTSGSTAASYFAYGEGTKNAPYGITSPRHLYNLAWLQYLGMFNKDGDDSDSNLDTVYFEIDSSLTGGLDMKDWVLPPIGNETYPFIGNFNGNGVTIKNLTVSNDFSSFNNHPYTVTFNNYTQGKILGFFGIIGQYQTTLSYDTSANQVTGLYLDNFTIKNSASTTSILAGFLAGYVNGTLTNSGVGYAHFDFVNGTTNISLTSTSSVSFENVSHYSLIGDYNSANYEWKDEPGSSSGTSYGTSTNMKSLYENLMKNEATIERDNDGITSGIIPTNYMIPFSISSSSIVSNTSSNSVKTQSAATSNTNFSSGYTMKATYHNIGYYSGEMRAYHYKDKYDYNSSDFGTQSGLTNLNLGTPPPEVLTYLTKTRTASDGTTYRNGDYLIRLNSGYATDDQNLTSYTRYNYIEKGSILSYSERPVLLPQRVIWVKPVTAGTFKFLFVNSASDPTTSPVSISYWTLVRNDPDDYSSYYLSSKSYVNALVSSYKCKYGYFEIKADANTEYAISFCSASGHGEAPYIAYMDIGATNPTEEKDTLISNIDFVYKGSDDNLVLITSTGYTFSNVAFTLNGTATSEVEAYFRRIKDTGVLTFLTGTGITSTTLGSGTTATASDNTCNTKATST